MPDADAPQTRELDHLIGELRSRVAARREEGAYPEGLEQDLDAHFRRITAHRVVPDLQELSIRLEQLRAVLGFSAERIAVESGLPGGEVLHRTISKVVARQTAGVLHQIQEFADVLYPLVERLVDLTGDPHTHVHADLVTQVDAAVERLAAAERTVPDSAAAIADLRRRVEALEAKELTRGFRPWFSNDAFEAAFRGSYDEILDRYRDLAGRFEGLSPVLDIGCGRGEFLELLAEVGVAGRGVELDGELAAAAAAKGLAVTAGDGLAALADVDDGSLGGIVLIQVVEHLTPQQVLDLCALSFDKLRPGGRVVIETVNPQSLYTFAHSFYVDPTHTAPVHPAYLHFLFGQAGFPDVRLDWRSPPPEDDQLRPVGDAAADTNVERLNRLLFAPQDYALVATK